MRRWGVLGKVALAALVLGLLLGVGTVGYVLALKPRAMTVGSTSMAPTYVPGQRVTLVGVHPDEIRRGDVVLIDYPAVDGQEPIQMLKRVVALGGDRIGDCAGSRMQLNGAPLDEPYLRGGTSNGRACFDVTVPEGQMFLLGDNRANSLDSRQWRSVPLAAATHRDMKEARGAVTTIGLLALATPVVLLLGLVLGLIAWRRRRNAPPEQITYPDWVPVRTP
ncbi:signal peptidase I [Kitasatospora sp. NPDC088391]|uniref:signal peptidase I n=1 Tax=Kitasatospora sp. NPDC088391 TaxID=3364074 RepID=UPI00381C94E0